ncbi:acrosin-like [Papio anubis]|uniref:acrosin-like n=1 Tax=Papio anubis TaxID=9555 RepID=UPI0012AD5FDD|nr:acrosin-like [Papio anubis]
MARSQPGVTIERSTLRIIRLGIPNPSGSVRTQVAGTGGPRPPLQGFAGERPGGAGRGGGSRRRPRAPPSPPPLPPPDPRARGLVGNAGPPGDS